MARLSGIGLTDTRQSPLPPISRPLLYVSAVCPGDMGRFENLHERRGFTSHQSGPSLTLGGLGGRVRFDTCLPLWL